MTPSPLGSITPLNLTDPPLSGTPDTITPFGANDVIGPQDTCTPSGLQTWGPPASNAIVNQVPDRDPSPVQWEINSDCILTIHHGTSPDYFLSPNSIWNIRENITKIHFDGNVTLYASTLRGGDGNIFSHLRKLREVQVDGIVHLAGMAGENMFYYDTALTAFTGAGLTAFETSQLTSMRKMFNLCSSLNNVDLSTWDGSNIISMKETFARIGGTIILPNTWNTPKVLTMEDMFYFCNATSITLPTTWNIRDVINMRQMFYACQYIKSLALPVTWNTSNVTNMESMFSSVHATSLTLPTTWNTSNVTNMRNMFEDCCAISLNLSEMDTRAALSDVYRMMVGCSVRELQLGPNTYLARTDTDSAVFADDQQHVGTIYDHSLQYDLWVEVPATGPRIRIPDLRARTSLSSGLDPQGLYVVPYLSVTIDYNNGETDHIGYNGGYIGNPGSFQINWPWDKSLPANKAFDGWELTAADDPSITLNGDTVSWAARNETHKATITAKWRSLGQPTVNMTVHADDTTNPWGNNNPWVEITATLPADSHPDDRIKLTSLNGNGYNDTCTPAAGTTHCTFNLTIEQLRQTNNFDGLYHIKTHVRTPDPLGMWSDIDGADTDKQGILPYTTINYHTGTGTGTPPATTKALTDTDSQKALLTVAGPDTITRPAHNLFTAWQARHAGGAPGTVRPGTTPVPASLGDTDPQGRTAIELTAQWTPLAAPALSAVRANDCTISVTGTSKPHHTGDTIRLCHPDAAGATRCRDITPDTNGPGGALPYDGNTEHPWTTTLPADTPTDNGTINAVLNTNDDAYTPRQPVQSDTGTAPVPHIYHQALPLTGGQAQPTLTALVAALATAMLLLVTATRLREQRRKARHRQTGC